MTGFNGSIAAAVDAIQHGKLVIYPTETVYGLGADALNPVAIERAFDAKRRSRENPISLAVPTIDRATEVVQITPATRSFMEHFLPGPVTVVCPKTSRVPDSLTAGEETVGVRIPDHDCAREVLSRIAPITATSANISGQEAATTVTDLDEALLEKAEVVLDGGSTPGGASTVVDPEQGVIYRAGRCADAVQQWLDTQSHHDT